MKIIRSKRNNIVFAALFLSAAVSPFFLREVAQAAVRDSYLQDFDNFTEGSSIGGRDNWNILSGGPADAFVQSGIPGAGMGKSLLLDGALSITRVNRQFSYGGITPTWIRFRVQPSFSSQMPGFSGGIGAVCFDHTGKVLAADGSAWVDTGYVYETGRWYDVAMRVDFRNHIYDLYLADSSAGYEELSLLRASLRFSDPSINSLSDIVFSGAYSSSVSGKTYIDDVSVSYIERIVAITASRKLMQGQASGPIIIQLQDAESFAQTADADITLFLKSTSSQGRFSLAREPWEDIDRVVFPALAQSVTIYYKDGAAGRPIVNVSEYPEKGYIDALQEFEVVREAENFSIEVVSPQVAGSNFDMIITAQDKEGNTEDTYDGTVALSVNYSSPASGSLVISPENVSGFIRGVLKCSAMYPDCGWITITAADSGNSSISGTSSLVLFVPAGFILSAETPQVIANPFILALNVVNASGELTPNYKGPVRLFPLAVFPESAAGAELTPGEIKDDIFLNGSAACSLSYNRYGKIRIRAEDSSYPARSGVSGELEFLPKKLSVGVVYAAEGREFFYVGEPVTITITVEDAAGDPVPNYSGTVELMSGVGLPVMSQYVFTGDEAGQYTFTAVPEQAGVYSIMARSRGTNLQAESPMITVRNATIVVDDSSSPVGTGEVVVTIVDEEGNIINSESALAVTLEAAEELDNDSVSLSSDPVTFSNGKITLPITNTEAETVTISVSSAYKIKIKKGSIIFGRAGKTGIGQLMWRELKSAK
ncbi:MAG: hypothetical protein GX598_06420 [Elusimicrobia bacterium]|nr:hypothetical protein [Elusimicrobiota bacterium]